MSILDSKYKAVRSMTWSLAANLSAEDQMIQSCPEASPVKWHQAHTTWFFETFVLRPFLADYKLFREEFHRLFNSYSISLGEEVPEKKLGAFFSRPSLDEVLAFRTHVDHEMGRLLERPVDEEASRRIILGLNHEQQHQELALTDIKHAFFSNPLRPSYEEPSLDSESSHTILKLRWHSVPGGLIEIGRPVNTEDPMDFRFDNETPRHKVYLEMFRIANRPVTCREYLEFMSDDAYTRPECWLSDGWETVKLAGWEAPLYWERDTGDATGWRVFTLRGSYGLSCLLDTPVCHISFFEADAFARWRGCRLPTEAEWEFVASQRPQIGNLLTTGRLHPAAATGEGVDQLFGDCWEWTSSLYGLSGIQAPSRGTGRIQWKVYVRSDGFARRFLRHACGSRARNLSELLSTRNALAIHGNTFSGLNGLGCMATYFIVTKLATNFRQSWTSVAHLSWATEICADLRIDPASQEGVSFAAGCGVRATAFGIAVAFKCPHALCRSRTSAGEHTSK